MYEDYKNHILNIISETILSQTNQNPNDETRTMLRDALVSDFQIPVDLAEIVASKAHISVDPDIFSDHVFMNAVVKGYATIIHGNYLHAYQAYVHPREVFLNLSEGLAISFNPRPE